MRFLVDAQLPAALARAMSATGHSAESVRDVGLVTADDERIWNYAAAHAQVIVTKDEDFSYRVWSTSTGPAVVWLRIGNCSNEVLLNRVIPLLIDIVDRIKIGDRLVEVT